MGGQLVFCCAVENICRVNMLLSGARVSVLASGTKRFCLRFLGGESSCCGLSETALATQWKPGNTKHARNGAGVELEFTTDVDRGPGMNMER